LIHYADAQAILNRHLFGSEPNRGLLRTSTITRTIVVTFADAYRGATLSMEAPSLETSVRVMYFDTDAGGVVHNIAYLRFIETNRSLLAEKLGWEMGERMLQGDCPVVIRTEIDYRRPARLWDDLVVRGWLDKFERTRFWVAFTIKRPSDGQVLITCRQMLVVVKLPEMKVQRLPAFWNTAWKQLRG
jgi:YbgC/YbaW family acyl-CoA thioester hydrolase